MLRPDRAYGEDLQPLLRRISIRVQRADPSKPDGRIGIVMARLRTLMKVALFLGGVAVVIYITAYVARLPESNCSTKSVSEIWSEDRAYKATILLKNCNIGETLFYSVRVDARSPPLRLAWFTNREIEDDERPSEPPKVRWQSPRALLIEMTTRTTEGTIRESVGDDLTIIRRFSAKEPRAFPNFGP